MAKYIYTFNLKNNKVEIESCNLVSACEKLLNNPPFGLGNFTIESRGNAYLRDTPFNNRTHIVIFNNTTVCEVEQKINENF